MPTIDQRYPPPPAGVDSGASEARGWGKGWPNCQAGKIRKITLSNGVWIPVRAEIAELTRCLLDYWIWAGYKIRQKDTGGFNCRAIGGTTTPSNHSWGLAVDVNWGSNPQGGNVTDIPPRLISTAWALGFYWGGWYPRSNRDPMHFEYVYPPARVAAHLRSALKLKEATLSTTLDTIGPASVGGRKVYKQIEDGLYILATGSKNTWIWTAMAGLDDKVDAVAAQNVAALAILGEVKTAILNMEQAPGGVDVDVLAAKVANALEPKLAGIAEAATRKALGQGPAVSA